MASAVRRKKRWHLPALARHRDRWKWYLPGSVSESIPAGSTLSGVFKISKWISLTENLGAFQRASSVLGLVVSESARVVVLHLLQVLWILWMWAPLVFKAKCFEGSSLRCRSFLIAGVWFRVWTLCFSKRSFWFVSSLLIVGYYTGAGFYGETSSQPLLPASM